MKISLGRLMIDAKRGEKAREILEHYYRKVTGDNVWSVKHLTVDELLDKIKECRKTKLHKVLE